MTTEPGKNYKKIRPTILKITVFKIAVIVTNFLIISTLISIVGLKSYGVYASIFSLMAWFYLFDFGLAKGMRNYLTSAFVEKKPLMIKKLISTAYIASFFISISLLFLAIFLTSKIDLVNFFNIQSHDNGEIKIVFYIFLTLMFSKLFFSSIDQIFFALHMSHINTFLLLMINVIYLGLLIFCENKNINSLIVISSMYAFALLTSYLVITFWFFYSYIGFKPELNLFSFNLLKNIFGDGFKILMIQLMFFTYLSLDRFILLKYTDEQIVANYDIIYKIMSLLIFPWSIISQPLWSSYAEAFKRFDFKWIKSTYKKILKLFALVVFGIFILNFLFDHITLFWINEKLNITSFDIFAMGVLVLAIMWCNIHYDIMFGVGIYKFGLITSLIGIILKFSSVYLIISIDVVNVFSIVLTSIFAYTVFNILAPIKIISILKSNK